MAASRVACSSFNIGSSGVITITKDKGSYTHTIKFKFGNASGTIATKTIQTSITWNPAAATLYAQIPNAVSGYGTITCETYDGNTLIGTTTAGFYAYAVKKDCLPVVSATIVDTNAQTIAVTGNNGILVCYISEPKVTVNATGKNSATIESVQIYNPVGLVATETPYTFDTVYSKDFIVKVVDSRGYITEATFTAAGFIDYEPCQFSNVAVKRLETTSTTAVATLNGYCFKGSFGSQSNALTVKYRYKTSAGIYGSYTTISGVTWNADGTFNVSANIPNLSLDETYILEFVVEDKVSSFVFDEVILGAGTGDIRIAKDYIQTKNSIYAGDINNTLWKCHGVRRKVNGVPFTSNFGTGSVNNEGVAVLELLRNNEVISRMELRPDGHLYNLFSSMSMAEIMAMAPSVTSDNSRGYMLLNGGNSNPVLIQWGRVHKAPDGVNVVTTQPVNFLQQFSGMPAVFLQEIHNMSTNLEISAGVISQDGFTLYIKRGTTATTGIFWLAIGNGSNALPE